MAMTASTIDPNADAAAVLPAAAAASSSSYSSRSPPPPPKLLRTSSSKKVTAATDLERAAYGGDDDLSKSKAQQQPRRIHSARPERLALALALAPPPPPTAALPPPSPLHDAAATTLQKVFKGHRTRRSLADCAIVVQELWWKLCDSASLDRRSISFFASVVREGGARETPASRWVRAGKRVARVGRGLCNDAKAQQLALRHWLEAIDPRHRYGHNLHLYYGIWFRSSSAEPFFYWLDVGAGRDVHHPACPRHRLNAQLVAYLGATERAEYEVVVDAEGRLAYLRTGKRVDTTTATGKWIFVLSTTRALYVGRKKKGQFQHSSFLAGGATSAAGRLVAKDGVLKAIWPYSGHYLPTEDNFNHFIAFLRDNNVDLTNVRRCSVDDDDVEPIIIDSTTATASATTTTPAANNNKWSSGAGPRIGCVRDYPAELQSRALEQVNLSPTTTNNSNNSRTTSSSSSSRLQCSVGSYDYIAVSPSARPRKQQCLGGQQQHQS